MITYRPRGQFVLITSLVFIFFTSFVSCIKTKNKSSPARGNTGTSNPWSSAGGGSIPSGRSVTNTMRLLSFSDGVTISYDGSSTNPADQEVCREETHNGQNVRVCMDLEDDGGSSGSPILFAPLMAGPQTEFVAWAAFADTLTCYVEGVRQFNCTTVFQTISSSMGESFSCEADLVNGDKALKCSDDWAIVVNGDEDEQEKTICRVNLTDNSGRCLSAPKMEDLDGDGTMEQVPVEDLIMEMQKTSWSGYQSDKANPAQMLNSESLVAAALANAPVGATISFQSLRAEDTNADGVVDSNDAVFCTVTGDGDMTSVASGTGTCKIQVSVEARGFVDRMIISEMEVVQDNDAAWAAPGYTVSNNLYPGENQAADAPTTTVSPINYNFISLTPSVCAVDSADGEVTAVVAGNCRVQLDATADGYLDVEIERSVTVNQTQTFGGITWASFPGSARVGVIENLSGGGDAPVADPPTSNISIQAISDGCNYSSDILSFTDTTACVVSVTATLRGYADFVQEFRVTPAQGTQTIVQDLEYLGTLRVGGELAVYAAPTSSAGRVSITYAARGTDNSNQDKALVCTVDAMGRVSAGSAAMTGDRCLITATLSASGRADIQSGPVSLVLAAAAGTQSAPSGWSNPYGSSPTVAVGASTNAPTGLPSGDGALDFRVKSGSSACSVNHRTGVVTGVSTAGSCEIEAHFVGDDDTSPSDYSDVATISVTIGNQMPPGNEDIYKDQSVPDGQGGNINCSGQNSVRLGQTTTPCAPLPGMGAGMNRGVPLELRAWNQADPNSGADGTACSVVADGTVTGLEVGGNCFVHARFGAATDRYNASAWVNISGSSGITITNGEMEGITWTPSQDSAMVGDKLTLDPVSLGNHASASGAGVAYTVEDDGGTGCDFANGSDVEERTLSFNSAGTCQVRATVTKADYAAVEIDHNITVTAAQQGDVTIAWSGYASSAVNYGEAAPALQTPEPSPSDATLAYASETPSVCTVGASSGALSILAGGTCRIRLTATSGSKSTTRKVVLVVNKIAQAALAATDLYSVNTMKVGETADLTAALTAAGTGDLELRATDRADGTSEVTSVCKVANSGANRGQITATGGGTCYIQARWSGDAKYLPSNWANISGAAGIAVGVTNQTAPKAWDDPYGYAPTVVVGTALAPDMNSVPPTPPNGSGPLEYAIKSGEAHCEIYPEDGMVIGLTPGSCVVQVRFGGGTSYAPSSYTEIATITVTPAKILKFSTVPTLAYTDPVSSGATLSPSGLPTTDENNVDVYWIYQAQGFRSGTSASGICSLTDSNPLGDSNGTPVVNAEHGKVLMGNSLQNGDTCQVQVMGRALTPGYVSYTRVAVVTISPPLAAQDGPVTVGWNNPYGNSPSVKVGEDSNAPGSTPSGHGDLEYQMKSSNTGCEVDENSGVVTGLNTNGGCIVQARFAGDSTYAPSDYEDIASITVGLGTQTAPSGTDLYSGNVVANAAIDPSAALPSGGKGALTLRVWGQANPVGGSASTLCSVQSDGKVTAGNSTGTCFIHAQFAAVANEYAASDWVNISGTGIVIALNSQTAPSGWSNPYGSASPSVAVGAKISISGSEPSGQGNLFYRVKSGSTGCSVVSGTGEVTGVNTIGGCTIEAQFAGNSTHAASSFSDVDTISVTVGVQSDPSSTDIYPDTADTGSASVAITGSAPSGQGTVEYRVCNAAAVSSCASSPSCSLASGGESSGVITTSNDAGTCYVHARFKEVVNQYSDSNWVNVSGSNGIVVNLRTQTVTGNLTYPDSLRIGGADVSPTATPNASGAQVDYEVTDEKDSGGTDQGDGEVCSVGSDGKVSIGSAPSIDDVCTVTASITRSGYAKVTQTASLTVKAGTLSSVVIPVYPTVNVGGGPYTPTTVASATAGNAAAQVSYSGQGRRNSSDQNNVCSVATADGKLTLESDAQANDICQVTIQYTTTGYTTETRSVDVSIAAALQAQTSVIAPVYTEGTKLYAGSGNKVWPETVAASAEATSITYAAQGRNSADNANKDNVCSVVESGNSNLGQVTVGTAAASGDKCKVTVTYSANGYQQVTREITLTVQAAISYTDFSSRILQTDFGGGAGSTCLTCHSAWSTLNGLKGGTTLNSDPTQAKLWKRVQRAHDLTNTGLGNLMPMKSNYSGGCNDNNDISKCLTKKDVEYVAAFLRGNSWN